MKQSEMKWKDVLSVGCSGLGYYVHMTNKSRCFVDELHFTHKSLLTILRNGRPFTTKPGYVTTESFPPEFMLFYLRDGLDYHIPKNFRL